MAGGRPTDYSEEVVQRVQEYLDLFKNPSKDQLEKIPTIEGLSGYLNIARSTLYDWRGQEGKEQFSDIFDKLLSAQANVLINKGLTGEFMPTITKVMLTKHGYREGLDQTTNDKDLPVPIMGGVTPSNVSVNNGNK